MKQKDGEIIKFLNIHDCLNKKQTEQNSQLIDHMMEQKLGSGSQTTSQNMGTGGY